MTAIMLGTVVILASYLAIATALSLLAAGLWPALAPRLARLAPRARAASLFGLGALPSLGGLVLALWGRDELAADSGVEDGGGYGGITLAHNVGSPAEVDRILAEAKAAGAAISRTGGETFWGGYSGVFVDPDGHPWEIAHNPHWTLVDDGSVSLGS